MSKVHQDDRGLFVRTGGYVFRPGPINGYDHAVDMSVGTIRSGDHIKARHIGGSPLCKIKLETGDLYWATEYTHDQERLRIARQRLV